MNRAGLKARLGSASCRYADEWSKLSCCRLLLPSTPPPLLPKPLLLSWSFGILQLASVKQFQSSLDSSWNCRSSLTSHLSS